MLDEQESKHAIRVLRLVRGDRVVLIDGRGGWYEAAIEEDHPKRCELRIISYTPDYQALPYYLHIAISPTKNMDRFEWFLEKATEIGISEITPLVCGRSERKQVKAERLERILVSAMKQSLKAYKPVLNPITRVEEFLAKDREGSLGIAHCMHSERKGIVDLGRSATSYTMLVGPEGDFTEAELHTALESGYVPFHLGDSRLRTETAGVYIASVIHLLSQT
jgi:16S rRNA (uracil1498-N3)-methyltransferase